MKKFFLTLAFLFALVGMADAQTLTVDPSPVEPQGILWIRWNDIAWVQGDGNYIGTFTTDGAWAADWWAYIPTCTHDNGVPEATGVCAVQLPAALGVGTYRIHLFINNGGTLVSNTFTVGSPAPTTVTYRLRATWQDNSDNEIGFYFYEVGDNALTRIGIIDAANVTQFEVLGAAPAGTQKCYAVSAYNNDGESGLSNVACTTIGASPSSPTNLNIE